MVENGLIECAQARLPFPYRENRDQEVTICDSRMQKEMNRAVGGCVMVPETLSLKWDSLAFCFSFHFMSRMGLGWGMTGFR